MCRYTRTHQLGRPTIRNPSIMDDPLLYDRIVKGKTRDLLVNGPDLKTVNDYTYQGNLFHKGQSYGGGYGHGPHHRTGYQADDDEHEIEKFESSEGVETPATSY